MHVPDSVLLSRTEILVIHRQEEKTLSDVTQPWGKAPIGISTLTGDLAQKPAVRRA
jgi:hypothetical protein